MGTHISKQNGINKRLDNFNRTSDEIRTKNRRYVNQSGRSMWKGETLVEGDVSHFGGKNKRNRFQGIIGKISKSNTKLRKRSREREIFDEDELEMKNYEIEKSVKFCQNYLEANLNLKSNGGLASISNMLQPEEAKVTKIRYRYFECLKNKKEVCRVGSKICRTDQNEKYSCEKNSRI